MESKSDQLTAKEAGILLISVCIVGFCTIIYELLIGAVSSYFLGDSIKQFSIVIGLSMTSMGIGTLISRFITKHLISIFAGVEILLAIIGGLSVPILYFAYMSETFYYPIMCLTILAIGTLIGLEIPILTRIMETYYDLKHNISNVLSLDYLGSFAATLIFPFVMVPFLGLFNTSVATGMLNLIVGVINLYWFQNRLLKRQKMKLYISSAVVCIGLIVMFIQSVNVVKFWEKSIYNDRVFYSKKTQYQQLVMTKRKDDLRLYIDGNVQFSSIDEFRYHELLTHIPLSIVANRENVIILGGGDGLAAREILKYKDVKKITLVDLDPAMTELSKKDKLISKLNEGSLSNPKVHVVNDDAYKYIEESNEYYDVIIIDLPDPNNTALARLYSKEFYQNVRNHLSKTGIVVTQASSPFFSPEAFWCINETMKSAGFEHTYPYHGYVPSFGDWGFVMASNINYDINKFKISVKTRYLTDDVFRSSFVFGKDLMRENIKPSTLDKPTISEYYLSGWKYW